MITDLKYYVKQYKGFLDKETCNQAINEIEKCNWTEHQFYDVKTNMTLNKSGEQELDVSWDKVPTGKTIMEKIWFSIKDYIDSLEFDWYINWSGYTDIRFNRYTKNKKMAEHCDHIQSMFDGKRKGIPILSVLGTLNDDYTGGDFVMFKNEKINLKQGDLIIFPSIFLYPHKVEPVTRGTRYSYISWVW